MSPKAAGQTAKSAQMVAPKQSPTKTNVASKMHRRSRSGMYLHFMPLSEPTDTGFRMLHMPFAKEEVRRRPKLLQSLQEFRSPVRIQETTMVE